MSLKGKEEKANAMQDNKKHHLKFLFIFRL